LDGVMTSKLVWIDINVQLNETSTNSPSGVSRYSIFEPRLQESDLAEL